VASPRGQPSSRLDLVPLDRQPPIVTWSIDSITPPAARMISTRLNRADVRLSCGALKALRNQTKEALMRTRTTFVPVLAIAAHLRRQHDNTSHVLAGQQSRHYDLQARTAGLKRRQIVWPYRAAPGATGCIGRVPLAGEFPLSACSSSGKTDYPRWTL
jgi:hypothetical protein